MFEYLQQADLYSCNVRWGTANVDLLEIRARMDTMNISDVRAMLRERSMCGNEVTYALYCAICSRWKDAVDLIVQDPRSNPSVENNRAIILAAKLGWDDTADLILTCGRASTFYNIKYAVSLAAFRGHTAVVEVFILRGFVEREDRFPSPNDSSTHISLDRLADMCPETTSRLLRAICSPAGPTNGSLPGSVGSPLDMLIF